MLSQCARPHLTFPRAVDVSIGEHWLTMREILSCPVVSSLPEAVYRALKTKILTYFKELMNVKFSKKSIL
jgi:hypothetical protein